MGKTRRPSSNRQAMKPNVLIAVTTLALGCASPQRARVGPSGSPTVVSQEATRVPSSPPAAAPASAAAEAQLASARQFVVAIAMLEGDTDRKMEHFIFDELRAASPILKLVRTNASVPTETIANGKVSEKVKAALLASGADLLICGEVIELDGHKRPSLSIVTDKSPSGTDEPSERYDVSKFSLPTILAFLC